MDDLALVDRLRESLFNELPRLEKWSRYYEGTQPMSYMAPELARELEGRVRQVVVNWPRLVVDALEERLDIEGFRIANTPDERLWEWWQANNLDEFSQMAHIDALTACRSYIIVGTQESGEVPLITVESPLQVIAKHDPRTRKVTSALKTWAEDDGTQRATLYLPDRTVWLVSEGHESEAADFLHPQVYGRAAANWRVEYTDQHNLGVVPVVPLVNRGRILDQQGVSELADITPISDAACKIATDMMVSAEFHAIPRRWIVGMTEDDMTDADGNTISKWDRIAGRIWASSGLPSEVQMGQFPEADLRNFHETLKSLAHMVAAQAGLPAHVLGMPSNSSTNPASADAIRSGEIRLVKRAERRQRAFGGSWEEAMRIAMLMVDGETSGESLETVWRDAATPTIAQRADAVVKLRTAGIISLRQAREDLGYSEEQIVSMEADDSAAVDRLLGPETFGPKPVEDEPEV